MFAPRVRAQAPEPQKPWPSEASQYRFHMIGNSHIDAVWLWTWPEGMSAVVSAFRSAAQRMKEDPEFTFTASSAQFYEWVAATDPKLMDEIRKRVKEGRWAVVGGWWVEPDVNMPSGESLVRQGLYGQRVFQQLFGRTVEMGFNPDSFGHPGTLPQILKLQGHERVRLHAPASRRRRLCPPTSSGGKGPTARAFSPITFPSPMGITNGPIVHRVHRIVASCRSRPKT